MQRPSTTLPGLRAATPVTQDVLEPPAGTAFGPLTASIAHDFNNLLAVMAASATMILAALPDPDPRRVDAEAIVDAATRATQLTSQLLALSRQHTLELSSDPLAPARRHSAPAAAVHPHSVMPSAVALATREVPDA